MMVGGRAVSMQMEKGVEGEDRIAENYLGGRVRSTCRSRSRRYRFGHQPSKIVKPGIASRPDISTGLK